MNGMGKYSDFGDKKNDQKYNTLHTISIITSSPWSNIGVPLICRFLFELFEKSLFFGNQDILSFNRHH